MPTIPDITIPSDDFVSVNTLSSVAVGTEIQLQLKGTFFVYLQESDTKPDAGSTDGILMSTVYENANTARIPSGSGEIWARCATSGRTSKINVEEV